MNTKGIGELKHLLELMEELDATAYDAPGQLQELIGTCFLNFSELINHNPSEEEFDHILNYCILKMLHAKQMVENGGIEEGLPFAKSVLTYFLKQSKP